MKYLTYLIALGGLIFMINIPAHATTAGNISQIVSANASEEVCEPTISSPAPGSDRR